MGVTAGWRRLPLPEVLTAYFGSGGPSASGFMESLQSERKTRKASFCRMWEKRAALWGPCRASASCHAGSASLADSSRWTTAWPCVGPRDVLLGHVPLPHQHVCGGDGGAVLDDAVHLLPLRPDSWQRHHCLLSGDVRLVAFPGRGQVKRKILLRH